MLATYEAFWGEMAEGEQFLVRLPPGLWKGLNIVLAVSGSSFVLA